MQLPRSFDAETVALMGRVCYDAWWELRSSRTYPSIVAEHAARSLLALRVMEAVGRGQRDPACLKTIALACEPELPEVLGRIRHDERRTKASAVSHS